MEIYGAGFRNPWLRRESYVGIESCRLPKGRKLEKAPMAGFSMGAPRYEMAVWNRVVTVTQSTVGFSRCKVAA